MAFTDSAKDQRGITAKQVALLESKARFALGLRNEGAILDWLEFEMDPSVKVYRLEDLTRSQFDAVLKTMQERGGEE